jgi:hypothetical protein
MFIKQEIKAFYPKVCSYMYMQPLDAAHSSGIIFRACVSVNNTDYASHACNIPYVAVKSTYHIAHASSSGMVAYC